MFPTCVLNVSPADPTARQYTTSQLEDAVKAVYDFISNREEGKGLKFLVEVEVEVEDTSRLTDHYAYDISSQHAHQIDADAIWDRISDITTRELGEQLHSIGMFDMDRTDSTVRAQDPAQRRADFLPTFAVRVYDDSLHNFGKIIFELKSVLQSYPGNPFQVRLLHTRV